MADKIHPSNAEPPKCCDRPAHSVNETLGTLRCLRCGAEYTFDGKSWVKPLPTAKK